MLNAVSQNLMPSTARKTVCCVFTAWMFVRWQGQLRLRYGFSLQGDGNDVHVDAEMFREKGGLSTPAC